MAHSSTKAQTKRLQSSPRGRSSTRLVRYSRMLRDHQRANVERSRLVTYLRGAVGRLPKAEGQLLLEFEDISRKKCERMRLELERHFGKQRATA
jgi:hypothetical protein